MPRKRNPYRLVLKQNRVEPQIMQGQDREGNPILLVHIQLSEDEPILLKSFAFNFNSFEEWLHFISPIMEKAAQIWPNSEWTKEYLSND